MDQPLVELKNVTKLFPGVIALDSANIKFYPGEVHGLMGENGAGKSTLIKLLTGAYSPDDGEIFLDGKPIIISNPKMAMNNGLTAIYQELNIIPKLSVWENIFLGRELRNKSGFLNIPAMKQRSKELLADLHQKIDINAAVGTLGMGHQQMVEICKALTLNSKLIIMDEPTSSLSEGEIQELLHTTRKLKQKGMAVVFISHHMDEVFEICDRFTVLRDGQVIETMYTSDTTPDQLVKLMVGRDITQQFPKEETSRGEEMLRVVNLSSAYGKFHDVSLTAYAGEVVGFSGLVGAGRTEFARALFGADPHSKGEVYIKGEKVDIRSPKSAIAHGMGFLTEDRKGEGLVLMNTVEFNISLSTFENGKKGMFLSNVKLQEASKRNIDQLHIKTPSSKTKVRGLSGGNQQKVVIGKWLETNIDIFIMDEPTRGLDVGAKLEVYHIINRLAKEGKLIIMISSELPEVLGMSDRILIMHEGHLVQEYSREEATQENVMKAASGGV